MSRHRQWRAWQFARRHRNQDMLGSMTSGNDDDPEKLNAIGRWFKRMGWKGELVKFILTLSILAILLFTHTLLAFLILCGIVWFIKTLFF